MELRLSAFARWGVSFFCLLSVSNSFADFFPLTPRASALGLAGTAGLVDGDILLPVYGSDSDVIFLDTQAKTAFNTEWLGSVGIGVRHAQGNERILGAYVFADRNVSANNNEYWFVSPGIESLGTTWDFRANGYIPSGTQRNFITTDWADNLGDYDYVQFQGHQQLDIQMNEFEEVGWGADVEIGRRVPGFYAMRAYVGGYYFNLKNTDDINGVAGRIEFPISENFGISVRDSYDNDQHNTIEVGLRVTLGGVNKNPRDPNQPIRERLLDPLERNLATLGQGVGEPVVTELETQSNGPNPPPPEVERDNIWFFSPSGTDSFVDETSCTAEHPCASSNFTQATIDGVNAVAPNVVPDPSVDPSFYLASNATYSVTTAGTPFTLTDDMLFGRSANFMMPNPTVLIGGLLLTGNDLLDHIILHNDALFLQNQGLTLSAGSTGTLVDTVIGADNSVDGYHTGVRMQDATLDLIRSEIHAFSSDNTAAIGIATQDSAGSTINLSNSLIKVSANLTTIPSSGNVATGIQSINVTGVTINLDHSTIDVTADASPTSGNVSVFGIDAEGGVNATENIHLTNNSMVTVSNHLDTLGNSEITLLKASGEVVDIVLDDSQLTGVVDGDANTAFAAGIDAEGTASDHITLNNGQVSVTATTGPDSLVVLGIISGGNSNTIDLSNGSKVTVNATITNQDSNFINAIGIEENGVTNMLTMNNSQVNITAGVSGNTFATPANVVVDGIETLGTNNTIILAGNSQVNITATEENGYAISAIGILAVSGSGTNAITLEDTSAVNVSAIMTNGNPAAGGQAFSFAAGIEANGATANNTITLQDNSVVDTDAEIINGGDFNSVNSFGVETQTSGTGVNTITVLDNAMIDATAIITNALSPNSFATAYGINASAGSMANNQISYVTLANIVGQATINGVPLPPTPIHTSP